jgi:hypothetical protein
MISNDNRNDNCVRERIQAGNRACFANLRILKIRQSQEQLNYKYIHKALIRPVATYGAETWTLTVTEENILRIFERKIIRKIMDQLCKIIYGR